MVDTLDKLRPTERFSSRVENYARYRPSYPPAVVELLQDRAHLNASSVIADVGSGTGIFTEVLLQNGNRVYAVEPNEKMRRAAEERLGHRPNFVSTEGAAESTGLAASSVDGVVVAQAFHWFNQTAAVAEFQRIARAGAFVALLWNVRKTAGSAFMLDYDRILMAYGSDVVRTGRDAVEESILRELFGPRLSSHVLANFQDLDWEGLKGRLLSASYMPLTGQDGYDAMLADLQYVFDRHQKCGLVRIEYDTNVYLAPLN
jgi:SAM-dependent methyltransferase